MRGGEGADVETFQSSLALYGYDVEITGRFEADCEAATRAFQRHFRPALVDGRADLSTADTLRRLLVTLPARTG